MQEKNINETPIGIIQLVNSENIIGPVTTTPDETSVYIEHPMSLMLDPMSGGLGMMPYLAIYTGTLLDGKVIDKKHIVGIIEEADLTPEILEKYNEYSSQVLGELKKENNQPPLPGMEDDTKEVK